MNWSIVKIFEEDVKCSPLKGTVSRDLKKSLCFFYQLFEFESGENFQIRLINRVYL